MALYKLLCALTVGILLTPNGCLSDVSVTSPQCGKADRSVEPADMPWQATLTNENADNCSAVLIHPETVMLTQECHITKGNFSEDESWVFVGSQGNKVRVGVASFQLDDSEHPAPTLVALVEPVNITEYVSPICLPAEGNIYNSDNVDSYVVYDMNTEKDESEIIGPNKCECKLGHVKDGMICAKEYVEDEDCEDLQGSAHFSYANGTWFLTGIRRYDPHCPNGSMIVTYTDMSKFQEYFTNNTELMDDDFFEYVAENDTDKYFVCDKSTTRRPMMSTTDPFKPPMTPDCPHPPTTPEPPLKPPCGHKPCCRGPCGDDRDSIFDGGVSLMHCSPFILLCLSVLSLYGNHW
ncbi:serine protease 53-like [Cheilinus undulatus]|uniref:serine protease 53-like n=1 Tax=Cheilinus undulatus TaxID=241271 RepID=UPI001BD21B7C|nr:serine protease 53-like [Cheilinus undulatus]